MTFKLTRRAWIRTIIYSGLATAGAAGYVSSKRPEKVKRDVPITGLQNALEGPSDPSKAMRSLDGESAVILLSHNPDVNLQLGKDKGVKLVLSGHTHGGQIRVPLLNRAPWVPCLPKYRGTSGLIRETQHRWTFITKGVGTFFVPVRLFCRPDIGILRLTRA